MRCRDLRDLAPRSEFFGRNVGPILSAIIGDPKLAVVGAGPQSIHGFERRSQRINDAALLLRAFGNQRADASRNARGLAGQVRADRLPRVAAIGSLEERSEEHTSELQS